MGIHGLTYSLYHPEGKVKGGIPGKTISEFYGVSQEGPISTPYYIFAKHRRIDLDIFSKFLQVLLEIALVSQELKKKKCKQGILMFVAIEVKIGGYSMSWFNTVTLNFIALYLCKWSITSEIEGTHIEGKSSLFCTYLQIRFVFRHSSNH